MTTEMSKYYITTPIYYVNGEPHLGHAYTSVLCDVMARFWSIDGKEVFFLSGTDEHGQKVEQSASKANQTPIDFADMNSAKFRKLLKTLNIQQTDFIRTTEDRHTIGVQVLWNKLLEKDMIYLGAYEGWYSIRDEAFYAESELIDGKAPTGADVEWVKEESYFFRLSNFTNKLLKYYEENPDFIGPRSRRNEVISFVGQEGGLKDLSISRTTFDWGIRVPNNDKHIIYVWLDALANYITALGYPDISTGSKYDRFWPADVHIVGKDILRFHAVYWPAFLMAAELEPPKRIFAHGWWTKNGEKMSKSLGNVLDPFDLVNRYGVDYLRYFLVSEIAFGNDGDFTDDSFITRINSDLANSIGNLYQRVMAFIYKSNDGTIPMPQSKDLWIEEDVKLIGLIHEILPLIRQSIYQQNMKQMIEYIIQLSNNGNKYIDTHAPWTLRKSNQLDRMNTVLYVLSELLRQIGILLQPLTPQASQLMLDQLGIPLDQRMIRDLEQSMIISGTKIVMPTPIFPKLESPSTQSKLDQSKSAPSDCKDSIKLKKTESNSSDPSPLKGSKNEINQTLIEKYRQLPLIEIESLITSVGLEIKQLKANQSDKTLIQMKVADLLALKESYKLANNGVAYEPSKVTM